MSEENNRPYVDPFPSVLGSLVFYRTYSDPGVDPDTGNVRMQTWEENAHRNAQFLGKLGELTPEQTQAIYKQQCALVVTPPGRVLWAAKETWVNRPGKANYLGLFNCVGVRPTSWRWLELEFLLLMMGCGVGSVVEEDNVSLFPPINAVVPKLTITHQPGEHSERPESTTYTKMYDGFDGPSPCPYEITIRVGDSKEGWAEAYASVLDICSDHTYSNVRYINVDLGGVRPNGEPIKGFGGTANPIGLPALFEAVITILRGAQGRQLAAAELCLLENEAAKATVAGNIRRSARWGGSSLGSPSMTGIKDNLWSQDVDGKWVVDEKRDALRMTNLSTIFHRKPTLEECVDSVQKQYDTGEGALWYAPAALVRTNVDILPTKDEQWAFEHAYTTLGKETARAYLRGKLHEKGIIDPVVVEKDLDHRMMRYGANPCCFVAGTMVLTRTGHYPIETLVDKADVEVWDGGQWVGTTFHITGTYQAVYEVILEDGSSITTTGYHKFILDDGNRLTLLDLKPGDKLMEHGALPANALPTSGGGYLKGFLLGAGLYVSTYFYALLDSSTSICADRVKAELNGSYCMELPNPVALVEEGSSNVAAIKWQMSKLCDYEALIPWVTTYRQGLPAECYNWSLEDKCSFIAGYMDTRGSVEDTDLVCAYHMTVATIQLLQDMQLLLHTIGVDSVIDRDGWFCGTDKEMYYLSIPSYPSIVLSKLVEFTRLKSFSNEPTTSIRLEGQKEPIRRVLSINSKGIADKVYCCTVPTNHTVSLSNGVRTGQCEILGTNFVCSLSQVDLSRFDTASPTLWDDIYAALDTAALIVCALLKRGFDIPELQESREVDPIVAVTLNGVFDFMVNLWGESWLRWWMEGCPEYWTDPVPRPDSFIDEHYGGGNEAEYLAINYGGWHSQEFIGDTKYLLNKFRDRVRNTVTAYCTEHNLRVPNRYTAMQPSGSKSCLTGGTPACYTPKAAYWVRRITLRRDHPVALAAIDYGYEVVPSSSCCDEDGVMLDNPYDERVTEWMVEVPDKCTWSANVDGEYDVAQAPITSQWYLTMACQKHFVTHNTSCTFEINKDEILVLAGLIYEEVQSGGNYVSAAIFARDGHTMPRMPYEPITYDQYRRMVLKAQGRRKSGVFSSMSFKDLVEHYHNMSTGVESGPVAGCDGDSCIVPLAPN